MRDESSQAELEQPAFDIIAALAQRECGLKIMPEKIMMVQSRLRHRLRALELPDFETYSKLVDSHQGTNERRFMISALTTNVSHFFREPHHFDVLSTAMLPKLRERIQAKERIRIWSAGCSNGQEPYSIAMHMLRLEPSLAQADFKILATDIDPKVVTFARKGSYSDQLLSGVSKEDIAQFFNSGTGQASVKDSIRRCVTFHELNLMAEWPMQFKFDAVFCRNVVIYFDVETQERLWPRFHSSLCDDGCFFLGHSERIANPERFGFKSVGPTAYKKFSAEQRHVATPFGEHNGTS